MKMPAGHLDVHVDAEGHEDRPHDDAEGGVGRRRQAHGNERGDPERNREQCLDEALSEGHDQTAGEARATFGRSDLTEFLMKTADSCLPAA